MTIAYPDPAYPAGRYVELPGRGTTYIRECEGPPGAPTVVMLEGWVATAGFNFGPTMRELAKKYHVISMDIRGQGRGIKDGKRFTMEDAADDLGALIVTLGLQMPLVAGYSMGSQIAETVTARHPGVIGGLVLISPTAKDHNGPLLRVLLWSMDRVFAHLPDAVFTPWWLPKFTARNSFLRPINEIGQSDLRRVVEAGRLLNVYSTKAIEPHINVPTAVVVSEKDWSVPPADQNAVAEEIPGARKISMRAGHMAWLTHLDRFNAAVLQAVDDVAARIPAVQPGGRAVGL